MTPLSQERAGVQNPMITYAQDIGWEFIDREEATKLRNGETGLLFHTLFISQLIKLNYDFMNDEIAKDLINRIERVKPNIEGNLDIWEYLKGLKTVFVQDENRERNVKLIDSDNIENNTFHVTDEYSFTNGSKTIRQDVVFLINGIPVLFVETKSAEKRNGIESALKDVKTYHRKCPELLAVNQIYTLTNLLKYFYSATWNTSVKYLFNWKEEVQGDYETVVKSFFNKERLVKLITDFILFTRKDDELTKVILRPHQIRAVNKIVKRAEEREKKRGLIWHTQGSGKTYTMIVTAKKIIENPIFENPTVIMLIDRNELQTQLYGNIFSVGIENVEIAKSKKDLRKLLKEDTRGLVVSMIHKFDDIPANINTRENIFILVDEAHRTTGGTLGNYLMGALPNATYIGFTGTPIDKTFYGKGTFVVFGKDDPDGYLDKYGIAESIADGTTVPLHYTLAPNELQVDRETLDKEFFTLKEAEGISDIEELNKILERAVTLRNMLKKDTRVEKVAKHISEHYKEYVEPLGYKAFVVGVDREACALYKNELDKYFPPEYSEVVYSAGTKDSELLSKYHLSDEKEKQIRKDFRNYDKLPKILIVTEKLLTGYDAPVLYCIYLDKPMRDHVLLQTIARVNRPYEDKNGKLKPSGFVLDFVGIFDNLEKALMFDSQDIEGVVNDIKLLKDRFKDLMAEAEKTYLLIITGTKKDKQIEAVLNHFIEEEVREEFYQFFKETSQIYDIISPDSFLRPFISDYETLVDIYKVVKESYEHRVLIDKEFSKKTAKLVQEHTKSGEIKLSLDIYKLDEELLEKIEKSNSSDIEKVFNLVRAIEKAVEKEGDKQLYLIAIGEKAEAIVEQFKKRQITTQEALEKLKSFTDEATQAKKERAEKNIPDDVFAIYWTLKTEGIDSSEEKANEMYDVLKQFPHYRISEAHEREIRSELYKNVLKSENVKGNISKAKVLIEKIMRVLKSV